MSSFGPQSSRACPSSAPLMSKSATADFDARVVPVLSFETPCFARLLRMRSVDLNSDAAASEPQRLCLLHLGQRLDPAQQLGGDLAVDLDQRDGVGAGGIAAEMEGGDVDAGIAERGREPADQARLVLVGDVEHRRPELGIHADALDV